MNDELLFSRGDIFSVIQGHTDSLKKKVQSIPANTLLNASEQDLIQAVIEEFRLHVPVIKDDDIYIAHAGETQVDVSRDPMRRFIYDAHSGPAYVPGNKTVIAVPFEGDSGFFKIRPQSYNLNPPCGEITKNEILLTYVRSETKLWESLGVGTSSPSTASVQAVPLPASSASPAGFTG